MRKSASALLAILTISGVHVSWAAGQTATGRITYIDPAKHQFMLDNAYMYSAAPGVNLGALAIAGRVSLSFAREQGREIATKVTPIDSSS